MDYICVGEVVNTHGLKGEVRISSDFRYKEDVFKKGFKVYVGRFKDELIINSFRKHKNYDMITFVDHNDINDIIIYKGEKVYINRDDLKIDGYYNEDLIGLDVMVGEDNIGKVEYIMENKAHEILVINSNDKKHLIPHVDEFINKVDVANNKIYINEIEGLINED